MWTFWLRVKKFIGQEMSEKMFFCFCITVRKTFFFARKISIDALSYRTNVPSRQLWFLFEARFLCWTKFPNKNWNLKMKLFRIKNNGNLLESNFVSPSTRNFVLAADTLQWNSYAQKFLLSSAQTSKCYRKLPKNVTVFCSKKIDGRPNWGSFFF